MGIIDKLKKGKKKGSVLDSLLKEKEPKEEVPEKPNDIEVRELRPSDRSLAHEESEEETDTTEPGSEVKPVREFRTEGMHEFDMESLGTPGDANIRFEYKARITKLIDENKLDEAMNLLQELKAKLSEK